MDDLQGKVAVVTGGASGIGFALAQRFGAAGMHLVIADVQGDALDRAVVELSEAGLDVLAVQTDVSDERDVQHLAAATFERFGTAHIVCNNAGVGGLGDAWTGPIAGWDWVVGVNLMGVVHGIRAFLPALLEQGEGHIVNTASMAGVLPTTLGPYSATKYAVVGLSQSLHLQLQYQQSPVGVSVLCPGFVRTKIGSSERNWPDRFGPAPVFDDPEVVARRQFIEHALAEGMAPAAVADRVHDPVRANEFWVFPHPEWVDLIVRHAHDMAEGRNPHPVAPTSE